MTVRSSLPKRWLKKWARRCVTAGGWATHWTRGRDRSGLRILTYHRIEADDSDPFAVAPSAFRDQMAVLSSGGSVTALSEALARLDRKDPAFFRIALTFDDGTRDFLAEALPILQAFRLPATLYVSPLKVGGAGFLSWEELQEISRTDIAVECHGLDHRSLGGLAPDELRRQIRESKRRLEDRLGKEVTSIAYPYGTVRDFDENVKLEVRQAGYQNGCSSINGLNQAGSDRFELKRTKIEQADQPIFEWILAGHLDAWSMVDRHLGSLQNRYR